VAPGGVHAATGCCSLVSIILPMLKVSPTLTAALSWSSPRAPRSRPGSSTAPHWTPHTAAAPPPPLRTHQQQQQADRRHT
jgi:hypothetical protein